MSEYRPYRSIVVGVDGSPAALAALEFAFTEALDRGAPVVVITTWMPDFPHRPDRHEERAARLLQDEAIERVLDDLGESPGYTQVVVNDICGPALVDAARTAALLVVGATRRDPLSRAFLGSVSEFCLRHSLVPVVVVPPATAAVRARPTGAPSRFRPAAR